MAAILLSFSGAFATVHVGTHKETLKPVAIKVIKKKKVADPEVVLREVGDYILSIQNLCIVGGSSTKDKSSRSSRNRIFV